MLVAKCHLAQWNITRSAMAKIESNVRRVTDIEIKQFSQVLKVSINALFKEDLN